jgi:stage V sporulation protein AA
MDVYVKMKKRARVVQGEIRLRDVADILPRGSLEELRVGQLSDSHAVVSITDVVAAITKKEPQATVNSIGETDTLISIQKPKPNAAWMWIKVGFVALVLLVGSATAIMSYHTDGQIPKIFERFFLMFFGYEQSNPIIITIPYSIGLAVGIIVFYNHFFSKKKTDDPTPIEVEMELYENDVTDALVDTLSEGPKESKND